MKKNYKSFLTMLLLLAIVLSLAACGTKAKKLSAPAFIILGEFAETLEWTAVDNTTGYDIQINDDTIRLNSNTITEYSLLYLEAGVYSIKIKAVGDGVNYIDSDWSSAIPFTLTVTEGLAFNLINDGAEYEVAIGTATVLPKTMIVIPSQYNDKPVTKIASYGFSNNNPANDYIKTDPIELIRIPSSVTNIGYDAFSGCGGLTDIAIPSSVARIEMSAFSGCGGLTDIAIPSSVAFIGYEAFSGCNGLTSITVDVQNTVYKSEGNCLISRSNNLLILGCKNSIIPSSVTSIGDDAFAGCRGLTSIIIPSSVTIIRNRAFVHCSGLTNIIIPSSVTSIGEFAFMNCSELASIVIPSSVTSIGEFAFFKCNSLATIYYGGGSNTEWSAISMSSEDEYLPHATVYYYSQTQKAGNYWHNVGDVPTKWN